MKSTNKLNLLKAPCKKGPGFFLLYTFIAALFVCFLLLSSELASAQCKNRETFRESISASYNSNAKTPGQKLAELNQIYTEIKSCGLQSDSVAMFLLQKSGVLYYLLSDLKNAVNTTRQSIAIAKACFAGKLCTSLPIVEGYYNLYYYYDQAEDKKEKYKAIDSCVAYALKEGKGLDMAISPLEDKVQFLFNKGEYESCIREAELGEQILHADKLYADTISTFTNIKANAIYFSGDIDKAETFLLDRKLRLEQRHNMKNLGAVYNLLGIINRDKGKYTEALGYFKKETEVAAITGANLFYAQSLVNIGMLYGKYLHQYKTGLEYCKRALKYADGTDSFFIFKETGNIQALRNNYGAAQQYFQLAFDLVQPGVNENELFENTFDFPGFNLFQNIFDLITDKGKAYYLQYLFTNNNEYLKKAIAVFKKGDAFLAKIKAEQHLQFNSNLIWRASAANLYEKAIEACYRSSNIEDGLYFFEKSRAALLNDQIYEQRWMNDTDITKLTALKGVIKSFENKIKALSSSSNEYFSVQHALKNSLQQYESLVRSVRTKNPLYYEHYMDTSFITLQHVNKQILNNYNTLLEIYCGDSAVYVLNISRKRQSLIKLNKALYDSLSDSYISFLTDPVLLNRNFEYFVNTSKRLYELVFEENEPEKGRVVISPDGKSFPFDALIMRGKEYAPDYFLNHYAVNYTYSAKYLLNTAEYTSAANKQMLGIAPVRYNAGTRLATLAGSDLSLHKIEKYYNNSALKFFEKATRRTFLESFPEYKVVQLYTHAADGGNKSDPVIYFFDSALYLSDLTAYQKPVTQLVVLSACQTGTGKHYAGEGIFSFSRGFAALDIPATISNLWSVDAKATYSITELFYKYLSEGLTMDIALQRAKQEFIRMNAISEQQLPYYWAAPIFTGKASIIKSAGNAGTIIRVPIIVFVVLLGSIVVSVMYRRKNNAES